MVKNGEGFKADMYKDKSFWLENSNDNLTPRPSLKGSHVVDVAIMGAGFTGLWTAYYLIRHNPSLNIAILEKEITGYGASGRNGGWCYPVFSVTPKTLMERYGKYTARDMQLEMFNSVTEIGNVIEEEGIQCDWALGGGLKTSIGEQGLPSLENELLTYKNIGIEDHYQFLNKSQTESRVNIQNVEGSIYTKNSAVLNPAKLARQLANLLEGYGVKIYEQTEVQKIREGSTRNGSKLITPHGTVTANVASVLAGEAYMSQLKGFKRRIIPVYSLITLTEPLTDKQWEDIGWENRELIGSTRYSINYLQRTKDGRILFGGRGQPYRLGSKIKDSFDVHKPTHEVLQQMLKQWFPTLSDIGFTHSWGGPVGMTRDWTPNIRFDKQSRIANAWGYVGQGVSTTNLAGRTLRDLIIEKESSLTKLPMVQHSSKNWEIEPFRFFGARFVQSGLERADQKSEKTGLPPKGNTLAERLGQH